MAFEGLLVCCIPDSARESDGQVIGHEKSSGRVLSTEPAHVGQLAKALLKVVRNNGSLLHII